MPTCVHHWKIKPPDGPISRGKCIHCGETRDFQNFISATAWGWQPQDGQDALRQYREAFMRESEG